MRYIKEFLALPLDEQQGALSHIAAQKGLLLVVVEETTTLHAENSQDLYFSCIDFNFK